METAKAKIAKLRKVSTFCKSLKNCPNRFESRLWFYPFQRRVNTSSPFGARTYGYYIIFADQTTFGINKISKISFKLEYTLYLQLQDQSPAGGYIVRVEIEAILHTYIYYPKTRSQKRKIYTSLYKLDKFLGTRRM